MKIFKQVKYLLIENAVLKQRIYLIEKALEAKSIPVRPLPPLPRNLKDILDKNDITEGLYEKIIDYQKIECPACNNVNKNTVCAGCRGLGYIIKKVYI